MPRETLVDFFHDLASASGDFLVYDNGYRTRRYTYRAVAVAAEAFAQRLQEAGADKGQAVLLWSENRPEWIAALWGCLLAGAVAVPIDYRSSLDFARRVALIVKARLVLVGEEIPAMAADDAPTALPGTQTWRLSELDWPDPGGSGPRSTRTAGIGERRPVPATADDVAEIIFTSGATAEPKGVLITHRNILANIAPIEAEVRKYRAWGRPFFPLRFLNLLPLSHLFGQAMATFIPPLLPGTVVFMRGYNPADIIRQVRKRRVSVLVSVPKILDVLRDYVVRSAPGIARAANPAEAGSHLPRQQAQPERRQHWVLRWWRYRRVHRAFGLKFWSFVVGAAPLDPSLEEFWSRLGFLVIQGYGLTETAPIVSLNHPFATRKGSVGKAIGGIEVRIAPDGEILVRGDNVTRGYYGDERASTQAFEDGWLHTGDMGEIDGQGQLFVRGRKKEMIVTPEGLNVFPEDVERVLDALDGVRESAVVGVARGGEERVHAVLVADEEADLEAIVRDANARLADHQRIRGVSRWPTAELPRTDGTRKLKRGEVQRWAQTGEVPRRAPASGETVEAIVARFASDRTVGPATTLEELGLSSLDRVELVVALEERFGATLDEARLAEARTVRDVQAIVSAPPGGVPGEDMEAWSVPSWNRRRPARWFRNASLEAWVLPLSRLFARLHVEGLEHLERLDQPVVFAANHQSHMDTPAVFAALPLHWRHHLAVAMAKEFFAAHFHPESHTVRQRATSGMLYVLAALFFDAFPLPQREAGTRRALRHIGDLLGEGCSVLIYPEGERTETGSIGRFRAGVGMIGSRLSVPIVPVRLEGLDRVLHRSWRMPRPGAVRVTFGPPLHLRGDDYAALAQQIEEAVRRLSPSRLPAAP